MARGIPGPPQSPQHQHAAKRNQQQKGAVERPPDVLPVENHALHVVRDREVRIAGTPEGASGFDHCPIRAEALTHVPALRSRRDPRGQVFIVSRHFLRSPHPPHFSASCSDGLCHFNNSNSLNLDAFLSKVITVSQPCDLAE